MPHHRGRRQRGVTAQAKRLMEKEQRPERSVRKEARNAITERWSQLSDREVAVLVVSGIEDDLRDVLSLKLKPNGSAKTLLKSKVSSLVQFTHALGMVRDGYTTEIRTLVEIRNALAHRFDIHTFDDLEVDIRKLKAARRFIHYEQLTNRERFGMSAGFVRFELNLIIENPFLANVDWSFHDDL